MPFAVVLRQLPIPPDAVLVALRYQVAAIIVRAGAVLDELAFSFREPESSVTEILASLLFCVEFAEKCRLVAVFS